MRAFWGISVLLAVRSLHPFVRLPRGFRATCVSCSAVLAFSAAPAGAETWRYESPPCEVRSGAQTADELLACHAPRFRVDAAEKSYNRIGTPVLREGFLGLRARVDPESPAVFVEQREDQIAGRPVEQLVYRVHFEKIPLRFSRYFFEAHRNPGLMVLLTRDSETQEFLFVSVVHTCGCYLALIPTDALDRDWLPEDWSPEQHFYGQRLPGVLPASEVARGVVVSLESKSHRVTDVRAVDESSGDVQVELPLLPMSRLEELPVEGAPGRTGSFFYESGLWRGRVRGAWNALEGLTLFGWISLDPTVGTDKQFGDPDETGTRFYTQLPFWMHERSRLDRFDSLLRAFGFRLPDA